MMATLQFIAFYLVMILWASALTFLPMLSRSSIHYLCSMRFDGEG